MEIDTICMSGGGIIGISYIGILDYLIDKKYIDIDKVINFVGTSVGSIFIVLLSIGYTPLEIGEFIFKFNFTKLEFDISIDNIFQKHGINNGERFEFMLKSLIERKININNISFIDLYRINNKTIKIIGTNFTKCTEEVFSWETTPQMPIITAIRISCSVPIIFTPVFYNNCWYIDGGMMNNFPIKYCNKDTTLGLFIKYNNLNENISSINNIAMGCINMVINNITTKDIDTDFINCIQILCDGCDPVDLSLTNELKLKLISNGQKLAIKFIDIYPKKVVKKVIDDIINLVDNSINFKYYDKSTQTDETDFLHIN